MNRKYAYSCVLSVNMIPQCRNIDPRSRTYCHQSLSQIFPWFLVFQVIAPPLDDALLHFPLHQIPVYNREVVEEGTGGHHYGYKGVLYIKEQI